MKNLLRFTLVVGDSNSTTFYSNLLKLIKMELAEAGPKGISINDITTLLYDNFDLEFTTEEIIKAIEKDKSNTILKLSLNDDKKAITYTLDPKECDKYKKKQSNILTNIVELFIKENEKYNMSNKETLINLVTQFIYNAFNEDKKTFLAYMNYKDKTQKLNGNHKFDENQIQIINDFLIWDNKEKDNYIYHSVSSCYEYCLLTLKKDNNYFQQVFNQKVFYLDSNILFKYILFENHEHHRMIKLFIEKCKSAGIALKYTNYTRDEMLNTISNYVKYLKSQFRHNEPISGEAIKTIAPSFKNYDFYEAYYLWQKQNPKKGFNEFREFLEKRVTTNLSKFGYESNETFESKPTRTEFDLLTSELNEYKKGFGKDTSIEPIKHDVNSYMFMKKKNSNQEKNSFMNVKYYFITLDKVLVNWSSDRNKGDIPTFVLPSVWYSTLLKYKNRTENDYGAFCKFLSITTGIEDVMSSQEETRKEILSTILELDEKANFKEELIYRIDKKLREENLHIENVDEFIEKEHKSLTDEKVSIATKDVENQKEIEIDRIKKESQENQEYSFNQGHFEGQNEIYDRQTNKIVKRNKIIRIIIKWFFIISLVVLTGLLVLVLFDAKLNQKFQNFNNNAFIVELLINCVSTILQILCSSPKFFSIDDKIIKDKVIKKLSK